MLNVLDLFSGIGGFSLGLERTGGFRTVAFCEIEPFCRSVLNKHWPGVPVYEDVKTLAAARLGWAEARVRRGFAWALAPRDDLAVYLARPADAPSPPPEARR